MEGGCRRRIAGARALFLDGELLVVEGRASLHALHLLDGSEAWTFALGTVEATGGVAADAERVFFCAQLAHEVAQLVAIDRAVGSVRWAEPATGASALCIGRVARSRAGRGRVEVAAGPTRGGTSSRQGPRGLIARLYAVEKEATASIDVRTATRGTDLLDGQSALRGTLRRSRFTGVRHRLRLPMLLLVLASCAPRLDPALVWVEVARCGMDPDGLASCRAAGGWPGRPLVCSGVALPDATPAEARAEERAFRTGEASCVCVTAETLADCARTP